MQTYSDVVLDRTGRAIQGASVLVKTGADTTATIYDANGVETPNPLTTDADGRFTFQAANGRYALTVLGPGLTPRTVGGVQLFDPAAPAAPVSLPSHPKAALPAAANYPGGLIYVSDESGGAVPAFSDGAAWRRVTDRAVVS